jgi:integrase
MANKKVSLLRYCRVDKDGVSVWKRYPAAIGRNGRIRPEFVVIDGQQVHCPAGHYELRYYEGRKLRYENAGDNAADALTAKLAKEKRLAAKTAAQEAGAKIVEEPGRKYIRREAGLYIQDRKNAGFMEAARRAVNVTDEFLAITGKTFLDEITKKDIYDYHEQLRKRGCAPRTVANNHDRLKSFLKFANADFTILPEKPKYEKTLPTVYTLQETASLLKASKADGNGYMGLVIEFGLKCGLREMEIVHLEWPDIHWTDKVLRVQGKPLWGFRVKDSEQRDVPVPDDLLAHLKTWQENATSVASAKHGKARLILGTKKDRPNSHLLRQLKRLANRAGLSCGTCDGCKNENECREWTLHKLRRTYCTTLLRNGLDLATIQKFMGHSSLASTMRYLRPAGSMATQAAISKIKFTE